MEILVLGPGCAKCEKTEKIIKEVIAETGADADVQKVTDMMKIAGHGIFNTPAVIVDGIVKCSGKVPSKDDVKSWIEQNKGSN